MLKTRVGEHIPKCLEKQIHSSDPIDVEGKYPASSIVKHLLESGYKVNINGIPSKLFTQTEAAESITSPSHWPLECSTPPYVYKNNLCYPYASHGIKIPC